MQSHSSAHPYFSALQLRLFSWRRKSFFLVCTLCTFKVNGDDDGLGELKLEAVRVGGWGEGHRHPNKGPGPQVHHLGGNRTCPSE